MFQDKLIDLVIPKWWTNGHLWVNRSAPNVKIFDTEVHRNWTAADYIVAFYIGDFEGGELVLKSKNFEDDINFSMPVKENQLYLLPIRDSQNYIPNKVTEGIKYSAIDWLYRHDEFFPG